MGSCVGWPFQTCLEREFSPGRDTPKFEDATQQALPVLSVGGDSLGLPMTDVHPDVFEGMEGVGVGLSEYPKLRHP